MDTKTKLSILADAAKYDASCASSGSRGRRAAPGGVGSTEGLGICHSYTPDGRCVSLLKLLLTNYCVYDCGYCINRRSSGVRRARFTPGEVVRLTLEFYRRNYIEGLFLSSGIIRGPDYTMEQLVTVARQLRREHGFGGYIHLKTIPNASPDLIREAGRYADRPRRGSWVRPTHRTATSWRPRRRCTPASGSGGCTSPPSVQFQTPPPPCRPPRRRCSGSTGCIRRTG